MHYWCSIIRRTHFPDELRIVTTKSQKIPTSSKVYSLNPFVDDQGTLRVGGRQQRARFSYNSRHPIILDLRHPLTNYRFVLNISVSFMVAHCLYPPLCSATFTFLVDTAIHSIVRSCVICICPISPLNLSLPASGDLLPKEENLPQYGVITA